MISSFFNHVGILRFPDEEVSLETLTLFSTQQHVFTYVKRLLDKMTPYEFTNDYCENVTEEETTAAYNEIQVELLLVSLISCIGLYKDCFFHEW